MPEPFLHPAWLIIPAFLCLFLARFFRLDARRQARPPGKYPPAPAMGADDTGRIFFRDPDGRPWYPKK